MIAFDTSLPGNFTDEQGRLIGVYFNMAEAEYHAVKAFSYSFAKEFARSPAHGKAYLSREWELSPNREMYKAVHLLTLEPKLQEKIVTVDGVWRGKVKDEVKALQDQGKLVLKPDALEEARAISASIKAHSLAGLILSHSHGEASFFWMEGDVYCKARVDLLSITNQGVCLGDLKNSGDLSSEQMIGNHIARMKYHWQQGWYSRAIEKTFGAQPIRRYWVFVETDKPHGVKVRGCSDAATEAGWLAMSQLLEKYAECLQSDVWPGYSEDEADAFIPDWAFGVVGGFDE